MLSPADGGGIDRCLSAEFVITSSQQPQQRQIFPICSAVAPVPHRGVRHSDKRLAAMAVGGEGEGGDLFCFFVFFSFLFPFTRPTGEGRWRGLGRVAYHGASLGLELPAKVDSESSSHSPCQMESEADRDNLHRISKLISTRTWASRNTWGQHRARWEGNRSVRRHLANSNIATVCHRCCADGFTGWGDHTTSLAGLFQGETGPSPGLAHSRPGRRGTLTLDGGSSAGFSRRASYRVPAPLPGPGAGSSGRPACRPGEQHPIAIYSLCRVSFLLSSICGITMIRGESLIRRPSPPSRRWVSVSPRRGIVICTLCGRPPRSAGTAGAGVNSIKRCLDPSGPAWWAGAGRVGKEKGKEEGTYMLHTYYILHTYIHTYMRRVLYQRSLGSGSGYPTTSSPRRLSRICPCLLWGSESSAT